MHTVEDKDNDICDEPLFIIICHVGSAKTTRKQWFKMLMMSTDKEPNKKIFCQTAVWVHIESTYRNYNITIQDRNWVSQNSGVKLKLLEDSSVKPLGQSSLNCAYITNREQIKAFQPLFLNTIQECEMIFPNY